MILIHDNLLGRDDGLSYAKIIAPTVYKRINHNKVKAHVRADGLTSPDKEKAAASRHSDETTRISAKPKFKRDYKKE